MMPPPSRKIRRSKCSREDAAEIFPWKFPFLGGEIGASGEIGFPYAAADGAPATAGRHRLDASAGLFSEADHFERLLDVQRARLALGVAAVVIINAVGEIGLLLNFAEHQARADGVHGAGGDEDGVARADRNSFETLHDPALRDGVDKILARDPGLESGEDFRAGPRADDVPHFRLAASAGDLLVLGRVGVIGMDLHGKFVLRENKFHEQREGTASSAGALRLRSGPFGRHFEPGLAEGFARRSGRRRSGSRSTSSRLRR